MSSSEDEAMSQKFERMASKIEENKEPLRVWSKRIKIAVALLFLVSTAFMNGVFSGQNTGEIVDRSFTQELMGWNNLVATLRESWFAIVALIVYLCLSEYNKRLDADEQKIIAQQSKEEKEFEVDDSETTSQESGLSS
jgi:large-conductance mechanosensitive channel